MLCEEIKGNIGDAAFQGKIVDYVEFDWDEAFKKLHKKKSAGGCAVGIRLPDTILTRGIRTGDVLGEEDGCVIAARIRPCRVIKVCVHPDHPHMVAKVCYEIGNRHASMFYGPDAYTFLTPYTEPLYAMLGKMHGVDVEDMEIELDFDRRLSASVNSHTH